MPSASNLRILKDVPLDSTMTDTIKFSSITNQISYFFNKTKYSYSKLSYIRPDSSLGAPRTIHTVRVARTADDMYDCNYIMFQNFGFGEKWFYAFIKSVDFISENNCQISFEIDHFQTWQFDIEVLPSFVEREHVNNDEIGSNTQPEPVNIGSLINLATASRYFTNGPYIIVAAATDPTGTQVLGHMYNNIYSGLNFADFENENEVNDYIQLYATAGQLEHVVSIFMSPFLPIESGNTPWNSGMSINPHASLDGHTVRNNKLLTSTYHYYELTNCGNKGIILKPENFSGGTINFNIEKIFGLPPVMVCTPQNYEYKSFNYLHSVEYNESPICPWSGNAFANWLSQNAGNMALTALSSVISTFNGNLGQAVMGGIKQAETIYKAEKDQAYVQGSPISNNFNFAKGRIGFELREYGVRKEIAERIDNFFDMYGYAVNTVKIPNMTGRTSWNYVKTENVIITGSIPVESMSIIKSMFDKGVRFWHGDFVGDYSRSNEVK